MKPKRDSISQAIHLPMTQESVAAFDTTVQSLRALALTALLTLHIDVRCGAIHMITRSLAGGNAPQWSSDLPNSSSPKFTNNWSHILSSQPISASPTILELNNDLISFDANISNCLGEKERQFITSGLARLIDRAFLSGTRFIGAMNGNGALRLQLDVVVLQQNLKNIIINSPSPYKDGSNITSTSHPSSGNSDSNQYPHKAVGLPRSAKFLDWFLQGPDKAVQYAKEEKEAFEKRGNSEAPEAGNDEPFKYDELKVLVELCFSAVLKGPRGAENREDFMAAKRANGDALLRLSEVMWDS
jgi:exocyst complex component 4